MRFQNIMNLNEGADDFNEITVDFNNDKVVITIYEYNNRCSIGLSQEKTNALIELLKSMTLKNNSNPTNLRREMTFTRSIDIEINPMDY